MSERAVVITGLGAVAPGGVGVEALFANLSAGRSAVKRINLFDASTFPCQAGGQLDDFSASKYVPRSYRKAVKVMARDIEIAVAAADLAVRNSGIVTQGVTEEKPGIDGARLGCNIGAGLICDLDELGSAVNTAVRDGKFDILAWGTEGMKNLTPLWLLKYLPNMLSCHVTIIHGAKGPSNTITCGESSSHLAVGEATRAIAQGACDAAIAGGAESKLNPMGLLRQSLLNRLNTQSNEQPATACRPFDAAAGGSVVGEGGGLAILEELSRAQGRDARIYAQVAGFGAACDPTGVDYSKPAAGGLARAVQMAMKDAGIGPEDVDLVIPHGTGLAAEDASEAAQWELALGARAGKSAFVPVTGATGNLFAGAGGVHLAVAAMAVHKQHIPAAVNFERAAKGCEGLKYSRQSADATIRYAICGTFGVGGQAAAVVLKRYPS